MVGWGSDVRGIQRQRTRLQGWGLPVQEDLRIGACEYEVAVSVEGVTQKVFHTDLESAIPLIEREAQKYAATLRRENPSKEYRITHLYLDS